MAYLTPDSANALALASRNADKTLEFQNQGYRGVVVVTDATTGSGTLTITIRGKDPVSGKTWNILVSAAGITSPATNVLKVYPGITVATNVSASDVLPEFWELFLDSNATALTYSVGVHLIP